MSRFEEDDGPHYLRVTSLPDHHYYGPFESWEQACRFGELLVPDDSDERYYVIQPVDLLPNALLIDPVTVDLKDEVRTNKDRFSEICRL